MKGDPMADRMKTTRDVPVEALRMSLGQFDMEDNGDGAKSAPVTMLARTGGGVDHPFFGLMVHDMDGMTLHKDKLPIDYCHDPDQVIGYLNRFSTKTGDLIVRGALTPFDGKDRAAEIIHKSREGVPYEASIDFSGGDLSVEEVSPGTEVKVNGRTFTGPALIFRKWSLRGVAVCPYGMDMNTQTQLKKGDKVTLEIWKDGTMAKEDIGNERADAGDVPAVETQLDADGTGPDDQAPVDAPADDPQDAPQDDPQDDPQAEGQDDPQGDPPADDPQDDPQAEGQDDPPAGDEGEDDEPAQMTEGQRFLAVFGDRGGVYFAQGMNYTQALEAHLEYQRGLLTQLNAQLQAGGDPDGVPFEPAPDTPKTERQRLTDQIAADTKLPPALASFAAHFATKNKPES